MTAKPKAHINLSKKNLTALESGFNLVSSTFLVSPLSLNTMKFPHSISMKSKFPSLSESSKFAISSISIPSTCSSTITTFSGGLSS